MTALIVNPATGEVHDNADVVRLVETIAMAVLDLDAEQAALVAERERELQRIAGERARLLGDLRGLIPEGAHARIATSGGVVVAGWVPGPKPRASVQRDAIDGLAADGMLPEPLRPRDVPQPARRTYPTVAELRKWAGELDRAGINVADLVNDPPAVQVLVVEARATEDAE